MDEAKALWEQLLESRAASRKRLIGDDSPYPTRPFSERVGRGIPAEPDGSENTFPGAALCWNPR